MITPAELVHRIQKRLDDELQNKAMKLANGSAENEKEYHKTVGYCRALKEIRNVLDEELKKLIKE